MADLQRLNIEMPTHYVKATDSIPKIIEIVSELLKKEIAYEKNGNVYFDITKFPDYGELSQYSDQEMINISAERGADPNDPNKRSPLDFILWQKSQEGEPFWESPFGKGRPGWHIECSAMVNQYLGDQIDIHGGGFDLIYPHHESEIAQSESFTGKSPYSKFWVHISMLRYQGEKMSKSLGNLVMVSNLIKEVEGNVIRFVLLSHHYRTPWEYTEDDLNNAKNKWQVILAALNSSSGTQDNGKTEEFDQFLDYLNDDMRTDKALESAVNLAQSINKNLYQSEKETYINTLRQMILLLGFNI